MEPSLERSILVRLRSETRLQHTQIEKSIPLFDGDLTREKYVDILKSFYGYVSSAERMLAPFLATLPELEFAARAKADLLRQDLQYLGLSDSEIETIPQDPPLPEIRDRAGALGAMYVLEGSTLGGQFIAGHLQKVLGITRETGGAYYGAYGSQTGSRWKAFQSVLQTQLVSETEQFAAILAAQQAFTTLECWMSQNLS